MKRDFARRNVGRTEKIYSREEAAEGPDFTGNIMGKGRAGKTEKRRGV